MLELLLCSLFTVVPDYLFRRYGQGKRIGEEITFFSVWYELRWGITGCLMLTVLLITTIFYFHPSTTSAAPLFRTVPILPEAGGRVAAIHVPLSGEVEAGQPLFTLDDSAQRAALESAERRIAEIDAEIAVAETDLAAADGAIEQARGALRQAREELDTRLELQARNPDVVSTREIERLQAALDGRQGAVDAALARKEAVERRLAVLLPAQRRSAEAARDEAQVALDKTIVHAGVSGRVEQFILQVGDFVSPLMRPAGVLIPDGQGRRAIQAGFNQIEARVIRPGMAAEVVCVANPMRVIPMVVTGVQGFIAGGQVNMGQQLAEVATLTRREGTILANLQPIYAGGLDDVPAGSNCIANAYTSHHDALASGEVGFWRGLLLHAIDATGIVHAILLRSQALLMPIRTLVLSGAH